MGKNSVIHSLGKCVGNIVLHKILELHTNQPESLRHLRDEVRDYEEDTFEKAQEFTWNDGEKEEIQEKALRRFRNQIAFYPDVSYKEEEVNALLEETIRSLLS